VADCSPRPAGDRRGADRPHFAGDRPRQLSGRAACGGGRPLGRTQRRPARPSAGRWSRPRAGASSSSSTCRSAPRSCSPAASGCRGRSSSTAACPTCRARRCWPSAWRRSPSASSRATTGAGPRPRPWAPSPPPRRCWPASSCAAAATRARSSNRRLWLPGSLLTGIGIGLAFPTLGSAAVRDVPIDRFATASAVNAAFRQIGAVLGTAILVTIVGEPATLAAALSVSDGAFLFAVLASLVSGAVVLGLRPQGAPGASRDVDGERQAAVAGGDLYGVAADLAE
jgi:hypothetical protein